MDKGTRGIVRLVVLDLRCVKIIEAEAADQLKPRVVFQDD